MPADFKVGCEHQGPLEPFPFTSYEWNGLPRRIFIDNELPVHIFTDGSLEGTEGEKDGGLGGVLVDSEGN